MDKLNDKIMIIRFLLYKANLSKYADVLEKSENIKEDILAQIKEKVDESIKACILKKDTIAHLLNLNKEGKLKDKTAINKSLCTDDKLFLALHNVAKKRSLEDSKPFIDITWAPIDIKERDVLVKDYLLKAFPIERKIKADYYGKKEEDMEKAKKEPFEWKEEHGEQFKHGGYPFPMIGDSKPKGWKQVDSHFVDSSGWGREGEAALTQKQFHGKLKAGRGYALTGIGQFQVHVGEFEREAKGKK
jgi:hypothetical protein